AIEGRITDGTVPFVSPGPLLARVGNSDHESLDDYRAAGGFEALARDIEMGSVAVIDEIVASNLRGRGGAAFPTGLKWRGASEQPAPRCVICNADEPEPGTFKDRVVMEGDPFSVVEALTIAGLTVGADRG